LIFCDISISPGSFRKNPPQSPFLKGGSYRNALPYLEVTIFWTKGKGGISIMALYIVQHGKSLPKDIDPEKGLSDEGRAEVEHIAEDAKNYGVRVTQIKHSGKKRAQQTAEIFASALTPELGVQTIDGIDPMDDVAVFSGSIDFGKDMMLVGHLPFMERLISHLITGSIERPVFKLQNGGILCLDKDQNSDSPIIKWALMPKVG
jgi:phosphohistidine phosphatase